MGEQMANLLVESRAPRPATSLLDPSTSLRAGSRGARLSTEQLANHDGKWKCTSCLEATGVPSSVAGW
jgi:hypothetical protein